MILKDAVTELIECWKEIAKHRKRIQTQREFESQWDCPEEREKTLEADRRVEDLQGLLEDINNEQRPAHDDFHSFDL